jgi:hypothetical protein
MPGSKKNVEPEELLGPAAQSESSRIPIAKILEILKSFRNALRKLLAKSYSRDNEAFARLEQIVDSKKNDSADPVALEQDSTHVEDIISDAAEQARSITKEPSIIKKINLYVQEAIAKLRVASIENKFVEIHDYGHVLSGRPDFVNPNMINRHRNGGADCKPDDLLVNQLHEMQQKLLGDVSRLEEEEAYFMQRAESSDATADYKTVNLCSAFMRTLALGTQKSRLSTVQTVASALDKVEKLSQQDPGFRDQLLADRLNLATQSALDLVNFTPGLRNKDGVYEAVPDPKIHEGIRDNLHNAIKLRQAERNLEKIEKKLGHSHDSKRAAANVMPNSLLNNISTQVVAHETVSSRL